MTVAAVDPRESSRTWFSGPSMNMLRISLHVPTVPIPQPRPVATSIHGYARVYEPRTIGKGDERRPHPVVEFKAAVKFALQQAYQGAPLAGGIGLELQFVMPRPKRMVWKSRPMPRVHRLNNARGRGDWDNIAKAFCDALNGLAWVDDSQICSVKLDIYVAGGDEQPHVAAVIREMT